LRNLSNPASSGAADGRRPDQTPSARAASAVRRPSAGMADRLRRVLSIWKRRSTVKNLAEPKRLKIAMMREISADRAVTWARQRGRR